MRMGFYTRKNKKKFAPSSQKLVRLWRIINNFEHLFLGTCLLVLFLFLFLNENPWQINRARAAELTTDFSLAKKVVEDIKPSLVKLNPETKPVANLVAEGYLAKPLLAETQVTKEPVVRSKTQRTNIASTTVAKTNIVGNVEDNINGNPGGGRSFPFGYCTYYAAQKRYVPWGGNAITWLSGARSYGFATGSTPQAGAIVVTSEGGRTGHVAMVDAVNGDQITLSEMNFRGFGVISSRTIPASYSRIMGYIY